MEGQELINTILAAQQHRQHFPEKQAVSSFIDQLYNFLFLSQESEEMLRERMNGLKEKLDLLLIAENSLETFSPSQVFEALPGIYHSLQLDAKAIADSDPAARSVSEVIATYPGFYATYVYRVAHFLWQQGFRLLPRFFTEYAHSKTGIDIHPAAVIGQSFAIDHGTGIVIGETSLIGNEVKIYQGVTLGALSVSKSVANLKRHPTIEDQVVIYAGATILGGSTVVGAGSIIGGNVWLTYSVPSNSVVYHKSEVHVKDNNPFPEPLNFVI